MIRLYHRLVKMPNERLTKRVLMWDINMTSLNPDMSTWSKEVKIILEENDLLGSFSLNLFNMCLIISNLINSMV